MRLPDTVAALQDDLVRLRRELHREPELGLHLLRTQERVLAAVAGLPLEVWTGQALSSVTAVLRGGAGSRGGVLLRADMDALPVTEQTGLDFAAPAGRMHACGLFTVRRFLLRWPVTSKMCGEEPPRRRAGSHLQECDVLPARRASL